MNAFLVAAERVARVWLGWMWPMTWQVALMGGAV